MRILLLVLTLFLITPLYPSGINIAFSDHVSALLTDCHCPDDSLGGLIHRVSYIKGLRENDKDLLLLDAGGWSNGLLDRMNDNNFVLPFYTLMGYDAVMLGIPELRLGKENVLNLIKSSQVPIITSNILDKEGKPIGKPYIILEKAGLRIGILSFIDPSLVSGISSFKFEEADGSIKQVINEIRDKVDIIVLLTQMELSKSIALGEEYSSIDLIIEGFNNAPQEIPVLLKGNRLLCSYGTGDGFGLLKADFSKGNGFSSIDQRLIPIYKNLVVTMQAASLYDKALRAADSIELEGSVKKKCSSAQGDKIVVRYFYSRTCNYCKKITDNVIPKLLEELPICVLFYDISNTDDYKKLIYTEQELRVKRLEIPAFTVLNDYISGERDVDYKAIKELIKRNIKPKE